MTINELREKRNQAWNAAKAFVCFFPKCPPHVHGIVRRWFTHDRPSENKDSRNEKSRMRLF